MSQKPYVLGIDAGGTSTRCWAVSVDGHLLGSGASGPGNFYSVGASGLVDRIHIVISAAVGEIAYPPEVLCLGAAGIGRPAEVEQVRAELEARQLARDLVIENDGFISLYAGTLGEPGVAVIAGTGSIAVGINRAKKRARAGGWGHLLGDEGSGYDIARQAIIAVLRAHDGRGPATSFATALLNQFGVQTPEGLIDLFYRQGIGKETVAAAAPTIIDAADKDAVAANIIDNATRELVMLGATTRRQLELTPTEPTVVSGGLFKDQRIYDSFLHCSALVCPGAQVIRLPWESALGAVFLALRQTGVEVGWDTARRLAYEMEVRKG